MIIPCYNHNDLVIRAVYSATQQTYADKEVIVVDDGSTNPLRNVWGGCVRVIRHESNLGLSPALNTGIAAAKGDRYIILAADDELRADCLAKLAPHEADIVACDFRGDKGEPVKCRAGDLETLITANCHSYAALVRRDMWQKVGGYKEMNPSWEDWEFWLNCAKHGATWAYVPEALHIYHRNPSGRDVESQSQVRLLNGLMQGYHQDLYGYGKGVVAFVIPCYNHEQWLPYTLSCIAQQTYPHKVAVVVDDGSDGDVEAAIGEQPMPALLVRQKNRHLSGARNSGIQSGLARFNPEYMVMLDADDGLTPDYVTTLMKAMPLNGNTYIYTDIQLIGDAWHDYETQNYDCELLTKQHIHPCTFLAPSELYQDVERSRGYIYDESMKQGYEDWEFALAALKAGWGGLRVPKPLLQYRQHAGGSMRTQASALNSELRREVLTKHSWALNKGKLMACSGCGANRVRRISIKAKNGGMTTMLYDIPGVGTLEGDEQAMAIYTGPTSSRMQKLGVGDTLYRYSNDPGSRHGPQFPFYARDVHLFANGPFYFRPIRELVATQRVAVTDPVAAQPALVMAEEPPVIMPSEVDRLVAKISNRPIVEIKDNDDFSNLGLSTTQVVQLANAGFAYFADIVDASNEELALVLSITKKKADTIRENAQVLMG